MSNPETIMHYYWCGEELGIQVELLTDANMRCGIETKQPNIKETSSEKCQTTLLIKGYVGQLHHYEL